MSTNTRSSKTDTVGDLPTQKDLSLAEEVPATTSIPEIVKCSVCYIPAALQCSKCQVAFCGAIHQKLTYYTHKHLCGVTLPRLLMQPDLTPIEMQFLAFSWLGDEVQGSFAMDLYSPAEYAISSVETIALLKSLEYNLRAITLFKYRNYASLRASHLVSKATTKSPYLTPFYSIAALLTEVHDTAISESNILIPSYFNFYSIMFSYKCVKKPEFSLYELRELLELVKKEIRELIDTIDFDEEDIRSKEWYEKKLYQLDVEERIWFYYSNIKQSRIEGFPLLDQRGENIIALITEFNSLKAFGTHEQDRKVPFHNVL